MLSAGKRSVSREDLKTAGTDEKESLLDHDSEPDEDLLFNRPSTSNGDSRVDGKMDNVRLQIEEVTDVMRENVQKVLERGERLDDLQEASDRLSMVGIEFRNAAKKAQRKAWMQSVRSRIIIVGLTLTVIVFIIVLDVLVLYLVLR